MTIIHLLIIGYTLAGLYVLKDLVMGSLGLYAFKQNFGFDPDSLHGLARAEFIHDSGIPITYMAAVVNAIVRFVGYSILFGVLYFVVSMF